MSEILQLALLGLLIAGLGVLIWWLFVATEGVYLGRRVVIWLYDLYANRYDGIKNYQREYEHLFLAQPIMEIIAPNRSPLVLDVATGTGRLPLALVRHGGFKGHIIGIDLSRQMLRQATKNIYPYDEQVDFIWCPAEKLPFADNSFDVVTCLEALEFMTKPPVVLQEMVRVLRPGGLLLTTQRQNTKLMPGKTWAGDEILVRLENLGIEKPKVQIWQVDYRKVWGKKSGESSPSVLRALEQTLRCPQCPDEIMKREENIWVCEKCGGKVRVGDDSVIELFPIYGSS